MGEGSSVVWIACPSCKSRSRFSLGDGRKVLRCPQCTTVLSPPGELDLASSGVAEELALAPATPSANPVDDDEYRIAPEPPAPPIWTVATQGQAKVSSGAVPPIAKKTPQRPPATDEGNPRAAVSERTTEKKTQPENEQRGKVKDKSTVPDSWVEPPENASLGWAFFSNTFTFSFNRYALPQWLAVSLGFLLTGFLTRRAILILETGGMYGVILGAFLGIGAVFVFMLSGSYAAAGMIDIITNAAYNLDKADNWPDPDWRERLWQFARILYLFALAAIVGWGLSELAALAANARWIAFSGAVFFLFPILLLSALESTSFLVPFSTSVWRSMGVAGLGWLVFYTVSAATIAIWIGLAIFLSARLGGWALWIVSPLEAAMIFTYGRFVGRLAWYIMKRTGTRTIEPERLR